nr:MAG TPA: Proline/betaine transporter, CYTOPLASMIC, COILED-COIL, ANTIPARALLEL, TWO-STRANDED [Caudoviricetes sp.]
MNNIYLVQRTNGNVIVSIMRNKSDNTYSFVNLTKGHICPCRFDSVEDAVKDIDEKILNGEIVGYFKLEEMKNG